VRRACVFGCILAAALGCGDDGPAQAGGGGAGAGGPATSTGTASTTSGSPATSGSTSASSTSGSTTSGSSGATTGAGGEGGEGGGFPSDAALCAVPSMIDLFPGTLPPNPYGDLFDADACVSQPHDVIIVLGCPNEDDGSPAACQTERVDIAMSLYQAGLASAFITTGAAVQNQWIEAETLRDLLVAEGVSPASISMDPLAQHTDENLYYATKIMEAEGWESALVVSDDPGHLVMTAVCDSNCCVDLGRLTIVELASPAVTVGHYARFPWGQEIAQAECDHIESPLKFMCINLATRLACKDNFQL
jgi:hypothetical protein